MSLLIYLLATLAMTLLVLGGLILVMAGSAADREREELSGKRAKETEEAKP